MKKQSITLFFSLIILGLAFSCKKTEADPDVLKIYGINEKVNGLGYAELSQANALWSFNLPADKTNPYMDETGEASTTVKQPLAGFTILASNFGGKTTRNITFPASNPVFLSPLGTFVWYYENDKCDPDWKPKAGQSVKDFLFSELVNFSDINKGMVSIKLDGTELMTDKTKFRFKSPDAFDATIHKDFNNPNCDYTGKKAKMVIDEYDMLLKIPKGKHILIIKGAVENSTGPFEAEVTWNLTVE